MFNTTPSRYGYACDAQRELKQQVARSMSAKSPSKEKHLELGAHRLAQLAGRPVAPRRKDQD